MKRERSTQYWIEEQLGRESRWIPAMQLQYEKTAKARRAALKRLRDRWPLVEFRLVKKSTVTTTTVVNGPS